MNRQESGRLPQESGRPPLAASDVVFDLDDFCDEHACLDALFRLRMAYPRFQATLFTIPEKSSEGLLVAARAIPWLELAVHGLSHDPNDEMLHVGYEEARRRLARVSLGFFVRGFKAPGWQLSNAAVAACNDLGLWIAVRQEDMAWAGLAKCGYYQVGERCEGWHGHTHDVCGNGVDERLKELLVKWPREQMFRFASEAVTRKHDGGAAAGQ